MAERPAPPAPRPGSRRGRMLATQRSDVNVDGYFVERVFRYQFPPIAPGTSQQVNMRIMSMRRRQPEGMPSYLVVPAARATLISSNRTPLVGDELAHLQLRLVLNGLDDWIQDGKGGNTASLALLFAKSPSPWFWFVHPHRLRAGDNLIATITNTFSTETPTMRVELALRMADADVYWDLYGKLIDIQEATDEDLIDAAVG